MKILIDTNVILDFLGVNKGFQEKANEILELAGKDKAVEFVSASAVTDIFYMLNKAVKSHSEALSKLQDLRKFVHILPVTEENIDKAIDRKWKDFEDAVQYTVAEANGVDYIVTRNTKDFEEDTIPCMTPDDFIETIAKSLTDES